MTTQIAPVLFLIFNRPDVTRQVFSRIREAKPSRLFVAADGPREGNFDDLSHCEECRKIIFEVDWPCEVKTLFRNENLGCKLGPSNAISWFFESVSEGIILEDDCFPSDSFFQYTSELLIRYRNHKNIMSIGGCSLGYDGPSKNSYGFCGIMNMWGWATWADRANLIDYSISSWSLRRSNLPFLIALARMGWSGAPFRYGIYKFWTMIFDKIVQNKLNTCWDYQWIYHGFMKRKISVFPTTNMIRNLGFGGNSTHTSDPKHPLGHLLEKNIQFPLVHPKSFSLDKKYMKSEIYERWVGIDLSIVKDLKLLARDLMRRGKLTDN